MLLWLHSHVPMGARGSRCTWDACWGGMAGMGCSVEWGPRCRRGRGCLCDGAKLVSSWSWWEVQQPADHLAPARGAAGAAVRGPGLLAGPGAAEGSGAASVRTRSRGAVLPVHPITGAPRVCAAVLCCVSCTRTVCARAGAHGAAFTRFPSRAAMCSRTLPQPVFSCHYPGVLNVPSMHVCTPTCFFHLLLILHQYLDEGRVKGSLHQLSDL